MDTFALLDYVVYQFSDLFSSQNFALSIFIFPSLMPVSRCP